MRPRTPISPPLMPTNTLPFTMKGAAVVVSPRLMSPVLVFHCSWPVFASSATTWLSSVTRKIFPLSYAMPRVRTSQQATPCAARS